MVISAALSNEQAGSDSRENGAVKRPLRRGQLSPIGFRSSAVRPSIASPSRSQSRVEGPHSTSPEASHSPAEPLRRGIAQAGTQTQIPGARRAASFQEAEQRLAELPRQGEGFDFERIYRMYSPRVFTLCMRMVRDREKAEDLTQDAFLQLFRKLHTFRGESAFRTWLFRLVTNVGLMHLRKNKRLVMQESPLEDGSVSGEESVAPGSALGPPDRCLAGANNRVALERAIQELAPGYRRILLLHDLEGYEHSEIAAMLGVRIGTSKSQLYKARRHVRRMLGAP